jgi:hypothetical protein
MKNGQPVERPQELGTLPSSCLAIEVGWQGEGLGEVA